MFCSNCGKSILPEEASCRHCGASYGEERFYGNTYTSAQVRILASKLNDAPVGGKVAYTLTDYFEQQPADDIYSNTAYRPLLRQEDDLTRIEAERAELEAEEEARLQAEEDLRRAEDERLAEDDTQNGTSEDEYADDEYADTEDSSENYSEDYSSEQASDSAPYGSVETMPEYDSDYDYSEPVQKNYSEDYSYGSAQQYDSEPEYDDAQSNSAAEDAPEYGAADASEDIPEDIPVDVCEDSPLPDDLGEAVISSTVLAHMEKQRLEEERRANNALRMAPLMNLTKKFTPPFMQQSAQPASGEQPSEPVSVRNLFSFMGRKNAPVEQNTENTSWEEGNYEEAQVEYENVEYQQDEYEQGEYSEAEYDTAEYTADESEENYDDQADYSDAEYADSGDAQADYSDAEYADSDDAQADYSDAEYADSEFDADEDAEFDGEAADAQGDDFSSFEDGETSEPKFKLDLNALKERFNLNVDIKALLKNRIVTIAAAAALIIAVIIGGVVWLNYITAQRSKIVDVTYETYQQGIEMLNENTSDVYRSEMRQAYISNSSFANTSFNKDMQAFNDLMPESPMTNDPLFVTTLTIIQDAIADAIKEDAKAELNGTSAQYAAVSELKWQAIKNAVNKLSNAATPGELSVIVSDLELVVAPTPTPTPTPPPKKEYKTLTNGTMDSDDVKLMQNRLINLGFLSGTADGDFGNGTEKAVKAFQTAAGLTADGIATSEMQEVLYSDDAPRADSSAPSNPSSQD